MKQIGMLLLACMAVALSSCRDHRYPPSLLAVDSLTAVHPDSAIRLLESLDTTKLFRNEADEMYYRLLSVKAADKADRLIPAEASILPLVEYYRKHPGNLLPTAYYYAGRTYYELHDAPQALGYFQQAAEVAGEDWDLKSCIYSNMGYIFMYQGLYQEAKEVFNKMYLEAKQAQDTLSMIFGLRDLSIAYGSEEDNQEALNTLLNAYKLASAIHHEYMIHNVELSLSSQYKSMERYDSALYYAKKVKQCIYKSDSSAVFSVFASLHKKLGNSDSVSYYYQKLKEIGSLYAKNSVYKDMTEIYLEKNDVRKAKESFRNYLVYDDSIKKVTRTEAIAKAQSLYNYQLREKENLLLNQENERRAYILWMMITIVAFLIISFFLYILYNRKKHQEQIRGYQRATLMKDEGLKKSSWQIEENKKRIAELEQEVHSIANDNQELKKALEREKERLLSENTMVAIGLKNRNHAEEAMMNSPVYRKFCEMASPSATVLPHAEDWSHLEALINREYNNFSLKLMSIHHLTEKEFRLSLLTKINMKPIEISRLLITSKGNVTAIRKRVYKKVFGEEAPAEKWDEFIHSL